MDFIPKSAAYAARQLNFSRSRFRIETQGSKDLSPNQSVSFQLPENALLDMKSFRIHANVDCTTPSSTTTHVTKSPADFSSLIASFSVFVGGVCVSQSNNDYAEISDTPDIGVQCCTPGPPRPYPCTPCTPLKAVPLGPIPYPWTPIRTPGPLSRTPVPPDPWTPSSFYPGPPDPWTPTDHPVPLDPSRTPVPLYPRTPIRTPAVRGPGVREGSGRGPAGVREGSRGTGEGSGDTALYP
jgi:hypothetical protein